MRPLCVPCDVGERRGDPNPNPNPNPNQVSDVATTTKLAELGVVFFLFEMGLELELER